MNFIKLTLLLAFISTCTSPKDVSYENLKVTFELSDYEEEYKSQSYNTFGIDSAIFYSRLKEQLSFKETIQIIIVSEINNYNIRLENRNIGELLNQDLGPSFKSIADLEVSKNDLHALSLTIDNKQEIEVISRNEYNYIYVLFFESEVHIRFCYSKCIGLH
ncbi:hypothetical protein [Fulvivirga lutimaris]|uniref:hypothetical protein n=1 Tax=Fulvivirga lutimaris TaxID=1819566 RepID=UPI0012BC2859|nr:hypothetical protein [Fulvivirga lutimaris]MTI41176.1 hypothetical protein [Fulvivirga lutimaris]